MTRRIFAHVCIGVDWHLPLLPHWLKHYKELGIRDEHFLIVINASSHNENVREALRLLKRENIDPYEIWIGEFTVTRNTEIRKKCLSDSMSEDDWVLVTDADEMQSYPYSLERVIDACESEDANVISGRVIDRVASDGGLKEVESSKRLSEQYPLRCNITQMIMRGPAFKIMAHAFGVHTDHGHHKIAPACGKYKYFSACPRYYDAPISGREKFSVEHYKWIPSVRDLHEERHAIYSRLSIKSNAPALLKYLEQTGNFRSCEIGLIRHRLFYVKHAIRFPFILLLKKIKRTLLRSFDYLRAGHFEK